MRKYLFLDIDGVLNHDEWFESIEYKTNQANWQVSMFDPECVARVNKILEATGAELVVSSSWRSMSDLPKIFAGVGLPTEFHKTMHADDIYHLSRCDLYNDLYGDNCDDPRWWRGSEIDYFIGRMDPNANYVILDDDCDMLPHQMEHFIQTCGDKIHTPDLYINNRGSGLTDTVMNKAIDILNGNTKETND
jgi:hypothetical protein